MHFRVQYNTAAKIRTPPPLLSRVLSKWATGKTCHSRVADERVPFPSHENGETASGGIVQPPLGASIYDVHIILGLFDPLPPLSAKYVPSVRKSATFHPTPSPFSADVIDGVLSSSRWMDDASNVLCTVLRDLILKAMLGGGPGAILRHDNTLKTAADKECQSMVFFLTSEKGSLRQMSYFHA